MHNFIQSPCGHLVNFFLLFSETVTEKKTESKMEMVPGQERNLCDSSWWFRRRLLAPRCIQMWLGDKVNLWKMHSILVPLPSAHWNASVNVSFFRLSRSSDRHLATHHHCFFFLFFFFHPWAPAVGNCFSAWKATHAPTTTRGLQAVQNVLAFIHLFTFTRLVRKEERKENAPECVLSVNPTCHLFPLCVSRSNVPISVIRQMCPN